MTFDKDTTASSTCENTEYTITPYQNYTECVSSAADKEFNSEYPFDPLLEGDPRVVTVQLDKLAPNVTCGFFPDANSINVVDDKTLYHYMLKKDGDDNAQKQDARFFYTVTVSTCDELCSPHLHTVPVV